VPTTVYKEAITWNNKIFGIRNKLTSLIKATMNDSTYHVKIGQMMTDGFKVGNGLKQGDIVAPNFFIIALEYVIRQLSV
jgi:hypothetical protein